jgi:membrane-associated protein
MRYRTFLVYNIAGAIVWGAGVTLLGYFLGQIDFIQKNIDIIFLIIVFVSVLPILTELFKRYRRRGGDDQPVTETPSDTPTQTPG